MVRRTNPRRLSKAEESSAQSFAVVMWLLQEERRKIGEDSEWVTVDVARNKIDADKWPVTDGYTCYRVMAITEHGAIPYNHHDQKDSECRTSTPKSAPF